MPNDFTGRKVHSRSLLPPDVYVANTILQGLTPCIVCAEPVLEGYMVCKECNALIRTEDNMTVRRAFERYRDRHDVPMWFRRARAGWNMSDSDCQKEAAEEQAWRADRRERVRKLKWERSASKLSGKSRASGKPRAKSGRASFSDAARRRLVDSRKVPGPALGLETRIDPSSHPASPSLWLVPESEIQTSTSAVARRHKAAKNRLRGRLCKMILGRATRDRNVSNLFRRAYAYGVQELLSSQQIGAPWRRILASSR